MPLETDAPAPNSGGDLKPPERVLSTPQVVLLCKDEPHINENTVAQYAPEPPASIIYVKGHAGDIDRPPRNAHAYLMFPDWESVVVFTRNLKPELRDRLGSSLELSLAPFQPSMVKGPLVPEVYLAQLPEPVSKSILASGDLPNLYGYGEYGAVEEESTDYSDSDVDYEQQSPLILGKVPRSSSAQSSSETPELKGTGPSSTKKKKKSKSKRKKAKMPQVAPDADGPAVLESNTTLVPPELATAKNATKLKQENSEAVATQGSARIEVSTQPQTSAKTKTKSKAKSSTQIPAAPIDPTLAQPAGSKSQSLSESKSAKAPRSNAEDDASGSKAGQVQLSRIPDESTKERKSGSQRSNGDDVNGPTCSSSKPDGTDKSLLVRELERQVSPATLAREPKISKTPVVLQRPGSGTDAEVNKSQRQQSEPASKATDAKRESKAKSKRKSRSKPKSSTSDGQPPPSSGGSTSTNASESGDQPANPKSSDGSKGDNVSSSKRRKSRARKASPTDSSAAPNTTSNQRSVKQATGAGGSDEKKKQRSQSHHVAQNVDKKPLAV